MPPMMKHFTRCGSPHYRIIGLLASRIKPLYVLLVFYVIYTSLTISPMYLAVTFLAYLIG